MFTIKNLILGSVLFVLFNTSVGVYLADMCKQKMVVAVDKHAIAVAQVGKY